MSAKERRGGQQESGASSQGLLQGIGGACQANSGVLEVKATPGHFVLVHLSWLGKSADRVSGLQAYTFSWATQDLQPYIQPRHSTGDSPGCLHPPPLPLYLPVMDAQH